MASYQRIDISQAFDVYDDILDVRSPAEYADDHLPGAISVPVLNDEERTRVGTLYKQDSPFAAKKLGAALIARNIAQHLEEKFLDKPKSWRPLVYCWRGGMRSGAMAHILSQVGWHTVQLEGGYKNFRRHVITGLETFPAQLNFRVISGGTGCGKSRLLQALAEQGAQVLDLERLAQHRGSLLGRLPGQPQPSQKTFETRLWDVMRNFSAERPVYVEAESRKVGVLNVPGVLMERMRAAACIRIEAPLDSRVKLLMSDYAHFLENPDLLTERLSLLVDLHGHEVINRWCEMARQGAWELLVTELLERHYDPAYKRTSSFTLQQLDKAYVLQLNALDSRSVSMMAENLIAKERKMHE